MVQTNYEGLLTVNGAPVGKELNESYDKDKLRSERFFDQNNYSQKFGSVVVVIATDAPVGYRNLRRAAVRSALGLARTGFVSQNQSGDYFIAFSTAVESRLEFSPKKSRAPEESAKRCHESIVFRCHRGYGGSGLQLAFSCNYNEREERKGGGGIAHRTDKRNSSET